MGGIFNCKQYCPEYTHEFYFSVKHPKHIKNSTAGASVAHRSQIRVSKQFYCFSAIHKCSQLSQYQ